MKLEQNRLNYHHHLGYAHAKIRIRCIAAVMIGLFITTSSAMAAGLWVANANSNTIAEYQGKLKKPHRVLNDTNDLDGPSTVAFNGGNLWVTNFNANSIFMYTSKQIKKLKKHTPTPTVIISEDTGSNLSGPEGLVFDSSGNMWVGAEDGQVIVEYTPAQFAASGNPTPNIILNSVGGFSSPSHLRFDSAGNLWVVDEGVFPNGNGGAGEVFKYTHAQITGLTAGSNKIDPVFGVSLNAFEHLETIAFDGGGNLWVADENGNSIYKFSASDLTGTGLHQNLTPAVVLTATSESGACNMSLDGPYGLAFNVGGELFVSNANINGGCVGSLAQFSTGSIGTTGSPTPKAFITNGVNSPNALTFGPTIP
jgi:ligand-binding sensor domain-containing protein